MMKRFVLVVLLISLAFAQIKEPKLVNEITARVSQEGSIVVHNGEMYSFKLNVTVPQNTPYQTVQMQNNLIHDSEGNALALISSDNPSNPFKYELDAIVTSRERITSSLPESYDIPADFVRYVQPSETVQSDSTVIKALAEKITAGSSNDFERIAKIAQWVHDNINYDLSVVGQRKDALWVLSNTKGVCTEYSSLFAALARSLGYPTRFVLGQAYGDYGWLGHAWNEVYLGEWVPVDATWLEVGHLDATHIEFFKSIESEATNRVVARVSDSATVQWIKSEFAGENKSNTIKISTLDKTPERDDYELTLVSNTLDFGGETILVLGVRGNDYRVIDARLLPCKSNVELVTINDPYRVLVLEPGKMTYAVWRVKASNSLNPRMLYTCPLTINSHYLEEKSVSLKIMKSSNQNPLNARLSDTSITMGESATVFVDSSSGETLTLVGKRHFDSRTALSSRTEFKFVPDAPGEDVLYVAAASGGVVELPYTVSKQTRLYVKSINGPDKLMVGETGKFTITIDNTSPNPEQLNIHAYYDNVTMLTHQAINGLTEIAFNITAETPGSKTLNIELTGSEFSDVKSVPFIAYEKPVLKIGNYSLEKKDDKILVKLPITCSSSVVSVKATLNSESVTVNGSDVSFLVEKGMHTVIVDWVDITGEKHKEMKLIAALLPEDETISNDNTFVLIFVAIVLVFGLIYVFLKIWKEVREKHSRL